MAELLALYENLLEHFGKLEWWHMERGFSPPEFEVCVGAILTQNTSWKNVERALENMKAKEITGIMEVMNTKLPELEEAIRPSGFYKQKARRLKGFADFVMGFGGFRQFSKKATREQLLKIKGIGPETADSILLYALNRPVFVIDAYTRRVFTRLGILTKRYSRQNGRKNLNGYDDWKHYFESNLPKDADLYKEFHALIVELAKKYCKAKPDCDECPLGKKCKRFSEFISSIPLS